MTENIKKFLEKVSSDKALGEKLSKMDTEQLIAAAKELGFELTDADLAMPEGELSDAELASTSGGATETSCLCVQLGAGGGQEVEGRDAFGCACVSYGQGGNGALDSADCRCVFWGSGEGYHKPSKKDWD